MRRDHSDLCILNIELTTPFSVRSPSELSTLLLLTSSARQPLITLFTASWCASCRSIKPLLTSLIETQSFSRPVSYAEIELDSPDNVALATEYFINSIPTLLSFRAGEAALESKVTDVREMADREFLRLWIESEAGKGGDRGGGGAVGMGVFGGLFGIGDK